MKNMKRILALVCIAVLAMTACCFALEENQQINFLLKADKDEIKAGETVNITIYAENYDATESIDYGGYYIYFDNTQFDSEGSIEDSAVDGYNAKVGALIESTTSVNFASVATFTFTAKADLADGAYTLWGQEIFFMDGNGNMNDMSDEYITDEITINVKSEEDEEVFEITSTGTALDANDTMKDADGNNVAAAGDKVIAIFAKNVSDAEIAAGSYGIVFGGVRYAGQAAVPAKTAWAIKLVGSADQLPAGSYSYSIFSGDAVVEATAPWVID